MDAGPETEEDEIIRSLVLLYNADWSVRGALDHLCRRLGGGSDCALCEITHHAVAEKKAWRACRSQLGVPVEAVYRNRVERALAAAVGGEYPAVVARTEGGYVRLLDRRQIGACAGDPETLYERLRENAAAQGLAWG